MYAPSILHLDVYVYQLSDFQLVQAVMRFAGFALRAGQNPKSSHAMAEAIIKILKSA